MVWLDLPLGDFNIKIGIKRIRNPNVAKGRRQCLFVCLFGKADERKYSTSVCYRSAQLSFYKNTNFILFFLKLEHFERKGKCELKAKRVTVLGEDVEAPPPPPVRSETKQIKTLRRN